VDVVQPAQDNRTGVEGGLVPRGERPLDDGDTPLPRFAADLRTLRDKADEQRNVPGGPIELGSLHSDPHISALAVSPDRRLLATGGVDGVVRVWDLRNPWQPVLATTLTGHTSEIRALAFANDNGKLATVAEDGTVRLWDPRDPRGRDDDQRADR
jgi:WD40 repeat protein